MGLLDDAIREHLDLKRRHGADAEEVARQEREALGAPVQGEFAQPGDAAADAPPPPAPQPEAAVDTEPSSRPEPDSAPDGPDAPEAPLADEPAARAAGYEEEPWIEDAEPDSDPPAARAAGPAPEAHAAPEDVLEETPDFLQETPEHERLWFEQKPPRDFDWDK
jgi:hypothetical protein